MQDKEIVELFLNRDEKALEEARQKYNKYLSKLAASFLRSKEDREECINDAYLAAWDSIPPNAPERLGLYLGRLLKRKSVDIIREYGAKKRGGGEIAESIEELSECIPVKDGVEARIEAKELSEAINAFLHSSPPEKRKAFIMRYWYGMEMKEISRSLKFSERKTVNILFRMRKELKNYLEERELV